MNGYIAFYGRQQKDIYADTLLEAKKKAIVEFKAPKKKEYLVSVMLAETDVDPKTMKGTPVTHVADF